MIVRVTSYSLGNGFLIQPVNGLGWDEEKPLTENVEDVHLLLVKDSSISLKEVQKDEIIMDYCMAGVNWIGWL